MKIERKPIGLTHIGLRKMDFEKIYLPFIIIVAFAALSFPMSWAKADPSGDLVIFHAGSLSVPFMKMEKEFEKRYPGVDILRESGGSTKMARLVRDVGRRADILASADYTVIDSMLIPDYADWEIRFASNQMVLCYTDKSRYADKVNSDNWFEILLKKDVKWGHADPDLDPCGYRSLMVMQLAERFYKEPGLYNKLIASRRKRNIRPKSVELISLLNTGNLDYAWEYLSVAVQHGLKFVRLDDRINLGNPAYDDFYKHAKVKVTGSVPGTWIIKRGRACVYGVTILKNARNKEAAEAFLAYLLDPKGGVKILRELGQPPLIPCKTGSMKMYEKIPDSIKRFVKRPSK